MLIEALCEFERAHAGAPDFYANKPVHWVCRLDAAGRVLGWQKRFADDDPPDAVCVPVANRGVAVLPLLMCDTAEYVLGVSDGERADRAALYKAAFDAMLVGAEAAGVPHAAAVRAGLAAAKPPRGVHGGHRVTFSVDDALVVADPAVQKYWANSEAARVAGGPVAPCSCCLTVGPTVRVMPDWVFGVPDALQNKCALVSANATSIERYGRKKATGASLCYPCARDAARGLNRLIEAPETCVQVGGVLVLVWGAANDVVKTLTAPDGRGLLRVGPPPAGRVHVLVLAARKSRAVVRDFRTHEAAALEGNLDAWVGAMPKPMPLVDQWPVVDKKKRRVAGLANLTHPTGKLAKVPHAVLTQFVLAATAGTPLATQLRAKADRCVTKADDPFAREAAASLRAACVRYPQGGAVSEPVNPAETQPYRCGELLAVLERIQRAAIRGINRTIADRCLRTVRTNPAAVLGRAMVNAKAHISKLSRNGKTSSHQAELDEVLKGLEFPARFTQEDQANFCLGYYSKAAAKSVR